MANKNKPEKKTRKTRIYFLVCIVLALGLFVLAGPAIEKIEKYSYPLDYSEYVTQYSSEYGIDPYFVYAVIRTESGFDPNAESSVGARGLMQMTEETFEWIKGKIAPTENITFDDLYQPQTSIRFGSYFLSLCVERYNNDLSTAAAAYHSGWGTVDKLLEDGSYTENGIHLTTFPYEQMNNYVRKINKSYEKYVTLYGESTS